MKNLLLFIGLLLFLFACKPDTLPDTTPQPPGPLVDTTFSNLSYGSSPGQILDLGLPAGRTVTTPLVIVVHGGGWSSGDKNELTWMLNGFKSRGFVVANINYRLTLNSSDNYKMQLDDLDSAIQFTLRKAPFYTFNQQKFYIVGHSAGGHLSLSYAYTRNPTNKLKAVGAMAAPTNLFAMAYYNPTVFDPLLKPFLGPSLYPITSISEQRYKNCSPQYNATNTSIPTILFHGESDFFITPDQSINLANTLETLSVEKKLVIYPITFHDWWLDGIKTTNTLDELKNWFVAHP